MNDPKKDILSQSILRGEQGAEAAAKQAVLREEMKLSFAALPGTVDDGTFRGALIITADPATGKNVLRIWGQRDIVLQAAIEMLRHAGVLQG